MKPMADARMYSGTRRLHPPRRNCSGELGSSGLKEYLGPAVTLQPERPGET